MVTRQKEREVMMTLLQSMIPVCSRERERGGGGGGGGGGQGKREGTVIVCSISSSAHCSINYTKHS